MEYLAHSARDGAPEQSYLDHVRNVTSAARQFAEAAGRYADQDGELLLTAVENAAPIHDLGKLDSENQKILHIPDSRKPLPIPHDDAGVRLLKADEGENSLSQMLISSHHAGLPDIPVECRREEKMFRSPDPEVRMRTDNELDELQCKHDQLIPGWISKPEEPAEGDLPVLCRMTLSCLADADHSDTQRLVAPHPECVILKFCQTDYIIIPELTQRRNKSPKEIIMSGKKNEKVQIRSSAAEYLTYVVVAGADETSMEIRCEDENIWLTQKMMAELYDVSLSTVNEHLKKSLCGRGTDGIGNYSEIPNSSSRRGTNRKS